MELHAFVCVPQGPGSEGQPVFPCIDKALKKCGASETSSIEHIAVDNDQRGSAKAAFETIHRKMSMSDHRVDGQAEFIVFIQPEESPLFLAEFVDELQNTDRKFDDRVRGTIVFISTRYKSSTPYLDDQPAADHAITNIRLSQFYTRMFESYHWSSFCHIQQLPALLKRIFCAPHTRLRDEMLQFSQSAVDAWKDDVLRIRSAVLRRLRLGVWVKTPNPESGGRLDSRLQSKSFDESFYQGLTANLLRVMALIHSFGRLDSEIVERRLGELNLGWLENSGMSQTFSPPFFRNQLTELMINVRNTWEMTCTPSGSPTDSNWKRALSKKGAKEVMVLAGKRNKIVANLFVFNLLRDCAQMLSRGAAIWALDATKPAKAKTGSAENRTRQRPIKILAIKDHIRGKDERDLTAELFTDAVGAAFREGTVVFDCLNPKGSREEQRNVNWDELNWWQQTLRGQALDVERHIGTSPAAADSSPKLLDYDILLIEADHSNRFVGASIVQWLDHSFDEISQVKRSKEPEFQRPQIVLLSRDENAAHSFMCLSLGAQGFASKSRPFSIPALLTMCNLRRFMRKPDKKRLRPNFYALDGLVPPQRTRLQSIRPRDIIHGDDYDRAWIANLPKADLHFHLGTSVTLDSIKAMAANTVGYLVQRAGSEAGKTPAPETAAYELVEKACQIVLLCQLERANQKSRRTPPYQHLWASARFLELPEDNKGRVIGKMAPDFNSLDLIISWLTRPDRPIRSFEVCAVIVHALTVFECLRQFPPTAGAEGQVTSEKAYADFTANVSAHWVRLMAAASKIVREGTVSTNLEINLSYLLERIYANWNDQLSAKNVDQITKSFYEPASTTATADSTPEIVSARMISVMAAQAIERSKQAFDYFTFVFQRLRDPATMHNWLWRADRSFSERGAEPMFESIRDLVKDSLEAPDKLFAMNEFKDSFSLEDIVTISAEGATDASERTLKRYLTGCDLLGAEHFQYPENLLLAGVDIAAQNCRDNVVYSEVRCATSGYARGGMNSIDATDLLCRGFDLGSYFYGGFSEEERRESFTTLWESQPLLNAVPETAPTIVAGPKRWVRINMLLGAKRHKKGDLAEVVRLVIQYLERGAEVFRTSNTRNSNRDPGNWWRPCSVAGFDLSGDEGVSDADVEATIQRLFAACSSITIHAGEAMSAKSIWEAVYKLSAQRIGHGLRLRDDARLLEYCVRNDICMELCPTSNAFTNVFKPIERKQMREAYSSDRLWALPNNESSWSDIGFREQYPLLDFMNAGLEVCINTDNRSLHGSGNTLSDEYLKAAVLCGGLTKWEILRVAKAGFKNAFLSKDDLAQMLRHVEYHVYKLVSEHSGEKDFPVVEAVQGAEDL